MLGSHEKPTLHCKAAEARGLLDFVTHLLDGYKDSFSMGKSEDQKSRNKMEGDFLLAASKAASNFEDILHATKQQRRVSVATQKKLLFEYHRFVVLFHRIEGTAFLPKTHLMYHLIKQTKLHGHPLYYHTYSSESMNGVIAKIARSCHRSHWCFAVFRKLQLSRLVQHPSKAQ